MTTQALIHRSSHLSVTGHSKGGAISLAVATWLIDTQHDRGRKEQLWDMSGKSTVEAYAFAGPTPGNRAFADHAKGRLPCRRVMNSLDIVPLAWARADLLKVTRHTTTFPKE